MSRVGDYRIRWAVVSCERMCIAERKTWLGWWSMQDADWRFNESAARSDIEHDKALRAPLPEPTLV
jgi:hypothetical protein